MMRLPKGKIFYFKNENVEGVAHYYCNDGKTLVERVYRKWGEKYFWGFSTQSPETTSPVRNTPGVPDFVQEIFEAKNRAGIARLRSEGKLAEFVDSKKTLPFPSKK